VVGGGSGDGGVFAGGSDVGASPRTQQELAGDGGVFDPVNLAVYHYASNNPLRYDDPSGSVDWDAVGSGVISTIKGVGKTILGAGIVSASGGGAVLSGGTASPAAVAGLVVGGAFVVDGFVEATTGFAIALAGIATTSDDIGHEAVPTSMSQMVGVAADAHVEVITGEETDAFETVGEWIGQQPPGVVDLLFLPTDVHAPGTEGARDREYQEYPTGPSTEMERP